MFTANEIRRLWKAFYNKDIDEEFIKYIQKSWGKAYEWDYRYQSLCCLWRRVLNQQMAKAKKVLFWPV